MEINKLYNYWFKHVSQKEELKQMSPSERMVAFSEKLNFGTAGVRAKMGLGSSYLNEYTIAQITEAVASCMPAKKIAISFDTRKNSGKFAKIAASILANHGIKVVLADAMPTPFLSFMVRFYRCDGGIMITASHNTKEYNGYKVYDNTGCQILPKLADKIAEKLDEIDCFEISYPPFSELEKVGLITPVGQDALESFFTEIEAQSKNKIENINVVYSSLNGTGINVIPEILKRNNVNVILNKVQCAPDPEFSTCPSPNPEKEEVFTYSRTLGLQACADLILCTDPDCDRLGVEVLHNGSYHHLTGNEVGVLLTHLLAKQKKKGYIMRSIVSSPLADKVAKKFGVETKVCLTGFKYIGEFLNELEKKKQTQKFVLGFEESCGYLAGNYARDKDAAIASLLICECASECKKQRKTLVDLLNEIYDEFGHYNHKTLSLKISTESTMDSVMDNIRSNLTQLNGLNINKKIDYNADETELPKTNMIEFILENNINVILRPSGTEPVIKAYITTISPNTTSLLNVAQDLTNKIKLM